MRFWTRAERIRECYAKSVEGAMLVAVVALRMLLPKQQLPPRVAIREAEIVSFICVLAAGGNLWPNSDRFENRMNLHKDEIIDESEERNVKDHTQL